MQFALSDEQLAIGETAKGFALEKLAGNAVLVGRDQ